MKNETYLGDGLYLRGMHERLKNIIENNCNTIGCKNCGLKFSFDSNSECSATELSSKIMEYENNNERII